MAIPTIMRPVMYATQTREVLSGRINIGGSGAVTSLVNLPVLFIARTGAGTYAVTLCKDATSAASAAATAYGVNDWEVRPSLKSAAGTVVTVGVTAEAPTSGTMTLVTRNAAGAATDPASGDVVFLEVCTEKFSV